MTSPKGDGLVMPEASSSGPKTPRGSFRGSSGKLPRFRAVQDIVARKDFLLTDILEADDFVQIQPPVFAQVVTSLCERVELISELLERVLDLPGEVVQIVPKPSPLRQPDRAPVSVDTDMNIKVEMTTKNENKELVSTVKMMNMNRKTLVSDALKAVAAEFGAKLTEDHGLFAPAESGRKGGRWLQNHLSLEVLHLTEMIPIQFKSKKRLLRVKNSNAGVGNVTTLLVDDSAPVSQVVPVVCRKLQLLTAGDDKNYCLLAGGEGRERIRLLPDTSMPEQGVSGDEVLLLERIEDGANPAAVHGGRERGWLGKMNHRDARYLRRWVDLTDKALIFFKSQGDKTPTSFIVLDEVYQITVPEHGPVPFALNLHTEYRIFSLSCSDAAERATWMAALSSVVQTRQPEPHRNEQRVTRNGWLMKEGDQGRNINKRWCTATNTHFCFYRSKEDIQPMSAFPIKDIETCRTLKRDGPRGGATFEIIIFGFAFVFVAEDEADAMRWMSVLNTGEGAADKRRERLRQAAYTLLASNPGCASLCTAIAEDPRLERLRTRLLDFVNRNPPLDMEYARYYVAVMGLMLGHKAEQTVALIDSRAEYVRNLISHCACQPMRDLLFAILQRTPSSAWLHKKDVMGLLMEQLTPVHAVEKTMKDGAAVWKLRTPFKPITLQTPVNSARGPGTPTPLSSSPPVGPPPAAAAANSSPGTAAEPAPTERAATPTLPAFVPTPNCPRLWRQAVVFESFSLPSIDGGKAINCVAGDLVFVSVPALEDNFMARKGMNQGPVKQASVHIIDDADAYAPIAALLCVIELGDNLDITTDEFKKNIYSVNTVQAMMRHAMNECEALSSGALTVIGRLIQHYVLESRHASMRLAANKELPVSFHWAPCKVTGNFVSESDLEMGITEGEIIFADTQLPIGEGWIMGRLNGKMGLVPASCVDSANEMEKLKSMMPPVLKEMAVRMPDLAEMFVRPRRLTALNGFRLHMIFLFHRLFAVNHPILDAQLVSCNILGLLVNLLFDLPNANIIHKAVIDILACVMGGSNATMIEAVVKEIKLHEKILRTVAEAQTKAIRPANMGQMTALTDMLTNNALTNKLLENVPEWKAHLAGIHADTKTRNSTPICPVDRDTAMRNLAELKVNGDLDAN